MEVKISITLDSCGTADFAADCTLTASLRSVSRNEAEVTEFYIDDENGNEVDFNYLPEREQKYVQKTLAELCLDNASEVFWESEK